MKRLLIVLFAAFAVCGAFAQTSANFDQQALLYVLRPDVQADLKLTADQRAKLEGVNQEHLAILKQIASEKKKMPAPKEMAVLNKDRDQKISNLLTPEQLLRLRQIHIQALGGLVLIDLFMVKELGLSEAQIDAAAKIWDKAQQEMNAIWRKVRAREMKSMDALQATEARRATAKAELLTVLTPEQTGKLKELSGPVFVPAPPPSNKIGG
jgi:hypothetical protein